MHIKLLRAYDEARALRELGKNVPDFLVQRIQKLEKKLISLELIPRIEDLMDYILQGYESPVSLTIKYYPDTQEILVEDLTKPTTEVKLALPKIKKTNNSPRQPLNDRTNNAAPIETKVKSLPKVDTKPKNEKRQKSDNINTDDEDVKKYFDDFRRMKRTSGAMGIRKAVMLLSMFDLISCDHFKTNRIEFDDTLVDKYNSLWDEIVPKDSKVKKDACTPFVLLMREAFYRVDLKIDRNRIHLVKDWKTENIRDCINWISFDGILFRLVLNQSTRIRLSEYLADLFNLNYRAPLEEKKISEQETWDAPVLKNEDEVLEPIDNYILNPQIEVYNQNEIFNLNSSVLWGAVAIATSSNNKKTYVIYDTLLQPLTKENIISFMLRALITRVLFSYKYNNEVDSWFPDSSKLKIIESLLKCTNFQEVDINMGKKTGYSLVMNRSILGFQVYTEFRHLTQMVNTRLRGEKQPELEMVFDEFVKNVAKQAFVL